MPFEKEGDHIVCVGGGRLLMSFEKESDHI